MEIKEIQKEKLKLEALIFNEIKSFENRTGVKVDSIELIKLQTVSRTLGVSDIQIWCHI